MDAGEAGQPTLHFAAAQSFVKGEDVVLTKPALPFPGLAHPLHSGLSSEAPSVHDSVTTTATGGDCVRAEGSFSTSAKGAPTTYGLFGVFDGHNGVAAAQHAADTLEEVLAERLPRGRPPPRGDAAAHRAWREALQRALVLALDDIQQAFACSGVCAGTTATILLQVGWLLTVATVGDSRAVLDTGLCCLPLGPDHRVATHREERRRLVSQAAHIAPIHVSGRGPAENGAQGHGPLRVWPGGLCLSRALGDFDVGPVINALPQVMQVVVPPTGGRVIMATDGLWDAFEQGSRVGKMARRWTSQAAPENLTVAIRRALGGLQDDTSIVVVDVLPPGAPDFPSLLGRGESSSRGGCFVCFTPAAVEDGEGAAPLGAPEVLEDIDVAALAGLMPDHPGPAAPGWFRREEGARLVRSQEEACKAWREAMSWVRVGKTPSRANLAAFFSQAIIEEQERQEVELVKSPREKNGEEAPQQHPALAGPGLIPLPKPHLFPEVSVRAGSAFVPESPHRPAAASAGSGQLPRTAEIQDPSVRFKGAVASSDKTYAQQFGAYRHNTLIPDETVHPQRGAEAGRRASLSLARAQDDANTQWTREDAGSDDGKEGGEQKPHKGNRRRLSLDPLRARLGAGGPKGAPKSAASSSPGDSAAATTATLADTPSPGRGRGSRPPLLGALTERASLESPAALDLQLQEGAELEERATSISWGGVVEASRKPPERLPSLNGGEQLQSIAEKGARGGSGSLFLGAHSEKLKRDFMAQREQQQRKQAALAAAAQEGGGPAPLPAPSHSPQ